MLQLSLGSLFVLYPNLPLFSITDAFLTYFILVCQSIQMFLLNLNSILCFPKWGFIKLRNNGAFFFIFFSFSSLVPVKVLAWMRWSLMLRLDFLQNKCMTFRVADKCIAECVIEDLQNVDVLTSVFVEWLWYNVEYKELSKSVFLEGEKKKKRHSASWCKAALESCICIFSIYFIICISKTDFTRRWTAWKTLLVKCRCLSSITSACFSKSSSQLLFVNQHRYWAYSSALLPDLTSWSASSKYLQYWC